MRQKKRMITAEGQVSEPRDQMRNSARRQQESKIRLKYKKKKNELNIKGLLLVYRKARSRRKKINNYVILMLC